MFGISIGLGIPWRGTVALLDALLLETGDFLLLETGDLLLLE